MSSHTILKTVRLLPGSLLVLGLGWGLAGPLVSSVPIRAQPVSAQEMSQPESEYTRVFTTEGVAILGTDPVAYFTLGQPTAGDPAYSHDWNGVTWHFATAQHRDLFAADPEKYAPQYGGFCAFAVSRGYTADIDPNAWRIVDDKLYLNLSPGVQARWERDIPGNISRADQNWPRLAR